MLSRVSGTCKSVPKLPNFQISTFLISPNAPFLAKKKLAASAIRFVLSKNSKKVITWITPLVLSEEGKQPFVR